MKSCLGSLALYRKIEQVYKSTEVKYDLLPLTQTGIDSNALSSTPADILHTTPYRSYPSGVTATATKRHEYVQWASVKDRYVIEDDFDTDVKRIKKSFREY